MTRRTRRTKGGYPSSGRLVTDLPRVPSGPAPGARSRDVHEPTARNSVVLLADGSIARRNADEGAYVAIGGPWTHYPAKPLPTHLQQRGLTDPGWAMTWEALRQIGVERVLHEADPS